MPLVSSDLKFWGSANSPDDDVSQFGGGVRNPAHSLGGVNPLLKHPASSTTIELVSDGADARDATVVGRTSAGDEVSEVVTLNGTSAVATAQAVVRLLSVTLDAKDADRTVTVRESVAGPTLATMAPDVTVARSLFEDSGASGVQEVRYALVYLENTSADFDLDQAVVNLTADPSSRIEIALATSKGDAGTTATRTTAPSGATSFVDDGVDVAVPGDRLAAGERVAVYVKQILPAAASTQASTFDLEASGSSVTTQAAGWSTFTPSSGSRIIFVSDTDGDDGTAVGTRTYDDYVNGTNGAPTFGAGWDPMDPPSMSAADLKPYKSLRTAIDQLRDGNPDWLLMKRGDTFVVDKFSPSSTNKWLHGGLSKAEPLLVGSYGSASVARPIVDTDEGVQVAGGNGDKSHIRWVGFHLYNTKYDPDHLNFDSNAGGGNGFRFLATIETASDKAKDWYFEDVRVSFFQSGISIDNVTEGTPIAGDWRFFRCTVDHNFPKSGAGHGQGFFITGCNHTNVLTDLDTERTAFAANTDGGYGVQIEECIIYENGWNPDRADVDRDDFSHNVYIQNIGGSEGNKTGYARNETVLIKNSIVSSAGSVGTQGRPGAELVGNVYIGNPVGFFVASNRSEGVFSSPDTDRNGLNLNLAIANDNVVVEAVDQDDASSSSSKNLGRGINGIRAQAGGQYYRNYSVNSATASGTSHAMSYNIGEPSRIPDVDESWDIQDNVCFNYPTLLNDPNGYRPGSLTELNNIWGTEKWATGNIVDDPAGGSAITFVDSSRTASKYWTDVIGGTGDWNDFSHEAAETMRRGDWDTRYTAKELGDWIKAGFAEV